MLVLVQPTTLAFAEAVRLVAAEARRRGLVVPGFRSPPGLRGADRSLRRLPAGGVIVAIRVRERRPADVVADVVEGVLAANRLAGDAEAAVHRRALLAAAGAAGREAA